MALHKPRPERLLERNPLGKVPVLVVDDNHDVSEYLDDLLTSWGLNVTVFNDPLEASRCFAGQPDAFDLVITDQTMPRLSGLDFASAVIERAPGQPVFVWVGDGGFLMTGHEASAIVQEGLPVKIIVCDNSAWGSIMTHQSKRFPGWDFGTRLVSPNFAALAEGYGMSAFPVHSTAEFEPALKAALAVDGPALIHLHLDQRDISPFSAAQQ